ncbi:MAG: HlyC/CorC family transporter [Planctomycetaceae bacterium]|nr:HlyC/CorC family transporter [Planctomycetaceae bacterium]
MGTIVSSVCFAVSLYLATSAYSLRNFLRSRLAQVCRQKGKDDRFGEILREDETALVSCELLFLVSLIGMVIGVVNQPGGATMTAGDWTWRLTLLIAGAWSCLHVIPWAISRAAGEWFLFWTWPCTRLLIPLTLPVRILARWADTIFHRLVGRMDPDENLETLAEEIQSVVDEGEREGLLESRAGRMIHRLMELRQEDVRAIMTPRTDIEFISVDDSLGQARIELLDAGHSRIPVIEENLDEIVGILYARDLLEEIVKQDPRELRTIVREPFYVPETMTIDMLLETMKLRRLHMAIVLDEYGGTTGLVTLEDILEEIVGDIADEFDEDEGDEIHVVDKFTIQVDARMHLDELNDRFDLELPEDADFDSIGGFVFFELGRIPKIGESFRWGNVAITVMEATNRQVLRLELKSDTPWPSSQLPEGVHATGVEPPVQGRQLVPSESEPPESSS